LQVQVLQLKLSQAEQAEQAAQRALLLEGLDLADAEQTVLVLAQTEQLADQITVRSECAEVADELTRQISAD
jgi:hypothetical protein